MLSYLSYMDKILNKELPPTAVFDITGDYGTPMKKDVIPTRKEYEKLIEQHLRQIAFFQHERLIHLLVTLCFALLAFADFFACIFAFTPELLILFFTLLVLLIPYIMHYFLLENGVQKMYRQYDELSKKLL